ncbi:MAG TPA: extracellular solute-binding protein [Acetobacteraceae bacterium]|nr:extracellular solute-binding protein [Acetobacteraceae bacterium]
MSSITRRQLGLGAAGLALAASARAQTVASVTRSLPRTYAGTTLNIVWGPEPVNAAMANFTREFQEATGINIQWTNVAHAERYQKIILDLTSNTNSFDVYLNAYQWKQELAPFMIDHSKIDQEVKGAPPMDWDDYPQRALEVYTRVGDKKMAIPLNGSITFLVWNKKAYEAAGLDPNAAPKTWEEVYQNGLKLRSGDQYGYNMPAGKNIQAACQWITLFHGLGGTYVDANGMPNFGGEAGVGAFKLMAERLEKISPPGNLTWDNPEMINAVATGQAAQGFMWTGGFSTVLDPAKSVVAHSLGYAPCPQGALLGGWAVSVNAKSRNLDAAKLFAAWLTCKENGTRLVMLTGQPARISAFQHAPAVQKFPLLPSVLAGLQGPVAEYPPIRQSEQICIFIYNEANAVCSGTKSAEAGAADLQSKVTDFMRRRGYLRG